MTACFGAADSRASCQWPALGRQQRNTGSQHQPTPGVLISTTSTASQLQRASQTSTLSTPQLVPRQTSTQPLLSRLLLLWAPTSSNYCCCSCQCHLGWRQSLQHQSTLLWWFVTANRSGHYGPIRPTTVCYACEALPLACCQGNNAAHHHACGSGTRPPPYRKVAFAAEKGAETSSQALPPSRKWLGVPPP